MAFSQHPAPEPLKDMNVTPLVDVSLVLLIVFMVTAPLMKQGFEIELPKATPQQFNINTDEPLTVTVAKDGALAVNGNAVPFEELGLILQQEAEKLRQETVFIEADVLVPYGNVIDVLDMARRLELKISLIYLPQEERNKPAPGSAPAPPQLRKG